MPKSFEFDTVRQHCRSLYVRYREKAATAFLMIQDGKNTFAQGKEELGIQSRYIHRGVYCPSPIIENIVTNIKRGKIATKIGNVKNPTNHYIFDTSDHLRISETYFPDESVGTEYIFYEENIVWGFEYENGHLSQLSIEEYNDDRLESYLLIKCFSNATEMDYECYSWNTPASLSVLRYRFLELHPHLDRCQIYRFVREANGSLMWERQEGQGDGLREPI